MSAYLTHWLEGTTCHRYKRRVLLDNDTHIVMKHDSHSEYLNRFSGSATCNAYAALYCKADIDPSKPWGSGLLFHSGGVKPIRQWNGRVHISKVLADCAEMDIQFRRKR